MLLKGEPYTNAHYVVSDYIDVSGKTEIRIHYDGTGDKIINFQIESYDTAKGRLKDYAMNTYLKSESDPEYPSPLVYPIQTGTAYVRMATPIKNGSDNVGYVYYTDLTYELVDEPDEPDEPDTPTVTLTSISAVYSGGSVTAGTAVSALTGIVVTTHYSDGTSEAVTDYTLSGTIAEGENTVTVSYGGKTTTFTVTGVAESGGEEATTPFGVEWTDGYLVSVSSSTIGENTANATWVASDYIDVTGKSEIRIHNDSGKLFVFQGCFFDAEKQSSRETGWWFNKQYVQGSATYPSPLVLPIPEGAAYCRLSTSIQYGSASTGYVRYDELTYELV